LRKKPGSKREQRKQKRLATIEMLKEKPPIDPENPVLRTNYILLGKRKAERGCWGACKLVLLEGDV